MHFKELLCPLTDNWPTLPFQWHRRADNVDVDSFFFPSHGTIQAGASHTLYMAYRTEVTPESSNTHDCSLNGKHDVALLKLPQTADDNVTLLVPLGLDQRWSYNSQRGQKKDEDQVSFIGVGFRLCYSRNASNPGWKDKAATFHPSNLSFTCDCCITRHIFWREQCRVI